MTYYRQSNWINDEPPKLTWARQVAVTAAFFLWGTVSVVGGQIPVPLRPDQSELLEAPAFFAASSLDSAVEPFPIKPIPGSELPVLSSTLTFGRNSLEVKQSLQTLANPLKSCLVTIKSEPKRTATGTIVSSDGLIVAKYSELAAPFHCVLPDGKLYYGTVVGIHPKNDLALIQIKADDLTPIEMDSKATAPQPGEFVVSIGAEGTVVGLGLISVGLQEFSIGQVASDDGVDLGVIVSPQAETREFRRDGGTYHLTGLKVQRVYPRTASESTGLLVGDLMRSINGNDLISRDQLNEISKNIKVGQTLTIGVVRAGQWLELSTRIKSFAQRTVQDRWGGGPYSDRRFGFGAVIAHDSVVAPQHCGGPLVDLDGRVVGINVARSMRVATFAIPIADIYRFVKQVRPNALLKLK